MQNESMTVAMVSTTSMPIKITESIFLADDITAHDVEWLLLNQISHVINCAGKHCQNNSQIKGMSFLTFDWSEQAVQNIIEQSVINAVVGFIQEAKRECGTVLIHGCKSESRPFCLLAIYFMIKYQWNIFKTLEFLNSRKEDTEVDSVFFQQLNVLHAKLQDRGMIHSKQWVVMPGMNEEEIILTNTFLNSKNKNGNIQRVVNRRKKKTKTLNWKENIALQHVYSCARPPSRPNNVSAPHNLQHSNINFQPTVQNAQSVSPNPSHTQEVNSQGNLHIGNSQKVPRSDQPKCPQAKQRSNSVKSKKGDSQVRQQLQNKSFGGKMLEARQALKGEKCNSILAEMNVTKKWTQLRQAWVKEKENIHNNQSAGRSLLHSEVSRESQAALMAKKQQKINDRLQEKLALLKGQQRNGVEGKVLKDITKDATAELIRAQKDKQRRGLVDYTKKERKQIDCRAEKKEDKKDPECDNAEKIEKGENQAEKNYRRETSQMVAALEGKLNNNWIISSQVLKDGNKSKQTSKSVIMVKPNHALSQLAQGEANRSSLRKVAGSERKNEKEETQLQNKKFFGSQISDFYPQRRSNSVKQERKDILASSMILKNTSSKGKWKV